MALYTINITVDGNGVITIPTNYPARTGDSFTWEVNGDAKNLWLVSFMDGDAFEVKPNGLTTGDAVHSVEVRNGEMAVVSGKKKGAFLYRVAVYVGGKIYAVLDCPSIIIK